MNQSITRGIRVGLLLAAVAMGTVDDAVASRPRVIKATPDNGAKDVDPTLKRITIVFDQDMAPEGMSVVGSGSSFPKIVGRPRWANPRTFEMTVKLQGGHDYRLSINSRSFNGFANAAGQSAVPYPIEFRTRRATGAKVKQTSADMNREAIEVLNRSIADSYSYRDRLGLDWDALIAQHTPELLKAKTAAEFAGGVATMLAAAKDLHIWLKADDRTFYSYRRSYQSNYNPKTLAKLIPNLKRHNPAVKTGRFPDGIGYIAIRGWDASKPRLLEPAYKALAEFAGAKGVIIDVRTNGGGAEPLARQFAGCFIDKPAVYAKHVVVSPGSESGFSRVYERSFAPNADRPQYRGKVAVLSGPAVLSSCEAFVLMMKQVPQCKVIGGRTGGSSGNPQPISLGNNVTVYLPCWQAMEPDGTCFEGKGVAPDITIKTTPALLRRTDPVLLAALKYLRKR